MMRKSSTGRRAGLRLGVCLVAVLGLVAGVPASAQSGGQRPTEALPNAPTDAKPGSITYEEVAYPHPVSYLPLTLYGHDVRMAYMDVPPSGTPNGRTVADGSPNSNAVYLWTPP